MSSATKWILEKPLVWMSLETFENLFEYSGTIPTGTTIGKVWKRQLLAGPDQGRWVLCQYVEDEDDNYVGIATYRIACAGDKIPTHAMGEDEEWVLRVTQPGWDAQKLELLPSKK